MMRYSFFLLILIGWTTALAQPLNFQTYGLTYGFPRAACTDLLVDAQGYLWAASAGSGLSRFDGLQTDSWQEEDGLPSNQINALAQTPDGRIWAGTAAGLAVFEQEEWRPVAGRGINISGLAVGTNGQLLAGSGRGLYELRQERLALSTTDLMERNITALFAESNLSLIGTDRGLYRIGDRLKHYELAGLPASPVLAIVRLDENNVLLAIQKVGLVRLNLRTERLDILNTDERFHAISDIIPGLNGQIFWLSSELHGLLKINPAGTLLASYGEPEGLNQNRLNSLVLDQQQQLWLASQSGDLLRCQASQFRQIGLKDGLPGQRIHAIERGALADQFYLAVSQLGVQQLRQGNWERFELGLDYNRLAYHSLALDQEGRLWAGSAGRGLVIADSSHLAYLDQEAGLSSNVIQQVVPTAEQGMWVATNAGLQLIDWQNDSSYTVEIIEGLPDEHILSLATTTTGDCWVGMASGDLVQIQANGRKRYFDALNGLPRGFLRRIAIDDFNRLWVAGPGRGNLRWADLQSDSLYWEILPEDLSLTQAEPRQLLSSPEGLWLTHEFGVDLLKWSDEGLWTGVENLHARAGFIGEPTRYHAAVLGSGGRRYFGTIKGLMEYQPGERKQSYSAPAPFFTEVSLFYEPISSTPYASYAAGVGGIAPGLELPHAQNHLNFSFRALDLQHPLEVNYRWRLLGAEEEWSPATKESRISYASLGPGNYSFEVQAKSPTSNWSRARQTSFTIAPAWYQRRGTQLLLFLGICTSAGLLFYLYVRRLKRREARRREELELRNQLLSLEQKALQLQMNPHFVFNALGSIQGLISREQDPARARQELQRFARLMRGILHNSRQEKISLAEEIKVLEDYLQTEQFCQADSFDYQIKLSDKLDADDLDLPPMLLQPFVENAILHGIAPLKGGGEIQLLFSLEDNLLSCRIIDNGIGREAAARLRTAHRPGHQSVAVDVTRQRLEMMRGGKKYRALLIQDGPAAKGTEVVIKLPVDYAWE